MKQFFRDFLTYSYSQRRGVLILLSIVFLFILYLTFSSELFPPEKIDFSQYQAGINSFSDSLKEENDSIDSSNKQEKFYSSNKNENKTAKTKAERFDFNPNHLSKEDWMRLGLSEKQIHIIFNYEEKGGKFRRKEDVKKMFCIPAKQYLSLEAYIKIPVEEKKKFVKDSTQVSFVKSEIKNPQSAIIPVEINSADSLQLITIKGIKGFYAKQLIKRRNQLGGFVSKSQLFELYKFDSAKYNCAEKYITINTSLIKAININTCTDKELKHPYLSRNMVNAIINYRKLHGKFKTIDEIKKTDVVDEETYRKIAPYLIIE